MKRLALTLVISAFFLVSGALADPRTPSADEIAIRKTIESYVKAYNRADTAAMASYWGKDGTYVSPSGDKVAKGPDQIQEALSEFFTKNKDMHLETTVSSVQIPSPDRAILAGIATYGIPKQSPEQTPFVATLEKEKGKWKLLSVEEDDTASLADTPQQLRELAWLIGEWVDRDEDASVDTTFRWTKNYSFITGSFTVTASDHIDLEGTQVIGWDPVDKKLKSWIFDSSGSFGQGVWTHDGKRWIVKVSSVLRTGHKASSVNIYTRVDDNTFTWQSIGREVGGELLPNIDEVTVVRRKAQNK